MVPFLSVALYPERAMAEPKTRKIGILPIDFVEAWSEWREFTEASENLSRALQASEKAKGAMRDKVRGHLQQHDVIDSGAVIDFNYSKGADEITIIENLEKKQTRSRGRDLSFRESGSKLSREERLASLPGVRPRTPEEKAALLRTMMGKDKGEDIV